MQAHAKRRNLPPDSYLAICAQLDDGGHSVESALEPKWRRVLIDHNRKLPRAAIETWVAAVKNPKIKRGVQTRLNRAEEHYKKAHS